MVQPDSPDQITTFPDAPTGAVDANWHARLAELGSGAIYESLGPTNKADSKARFMEEHSDPEFEYGKVDLNDLAEKERGLLTLKREIINTEQNKAVRWEYRWSINERIAKLRILRAAATGNMREFIAYNNFIYGKPNPELFAYAAHEMRNIIQKRLDRTEDDEAKRAGEAALAVFVNSPDATRADITPELFRAVREISWQDLGPLIEGIEIPEKGGPEVVKPIIDEVGQRIGGGWHGRYREDDETTYKTSPEAKAVDIPKPGKGVTLPRDRIIGLPVFHEALHHGLTSENGSNSNFLLAGSGLDRYEFGGEGGGVQREQIVYEGMDQFKALVRYQDILDRYIAIGLAYGLDGKPRTFTEVYDALFALKYSAKLGTKGAVSAEAARTKAANAAWSLTVRVMKGVAPGTVGAAYTKDMTYWQGNLALWDYQESHPEATHHLTIGKFDLANERHRVILSYLGLIPGQRASEEELEDLIERSQPGSEQYKQAA